MCRLEEANCIERAVQKTIQLAKNESASIREAACLSAGNLALAEVLGTISSRSALRKLTPAMVALLSHDQVSEVQRLQLHVSPYRIHWYTFQRGREKNKESLSQSVALSVSNGLMRRSEEGGMGWGLMVKKLDGGSPPPVWSCRGFRLTYKTPTIPVYPWYVPSRRQAKLSCQMPRLPFRAML